MRVAPWANRHARSILFLLAALVLGGIVGTWALPVSLFPHVNFPRIRVNLDAGERPQIVIRAGTWFGTALSDGASHCLVGCTVAPGFEFADFELAEGPELEARYPEAAVWIRRMYRR